MAVAQQGNQSAVTGRIERDSDNSAVSGAVVSALRASDGRLVAMALSSGNGNFTIKSLPAGDYWLHVTPLEGGMSSANLTGNGTVHTDFAAAFYGNYSAPTVFNVAGPNDSVNAGTLGVPADTTMRETTSGAVLLRRGQWSRARIGAVVAVAAIVIGWGVGQYPDVLVDHAEIDAFFEYLT